MDMITAHPAWDNSIWKMHYLILAPIVALCRYATHLNAHIPLLTEHPPNMKPEESDAISVAATDSLLSESND